MGEDQTGEADGDGHDHSTAELEDHPLKRRHLGAKFTQVIVDASKALAHAAFEGFEALIGSVEPMVDGIESLVDRFKTLVDRFKTLVDRFESLVDGFESLVDDVEAMIDRIEAAIGVLPELVEAFVGPALSHLFHDGIVSDKMSRVCAETVNLCP
ncbi:MAG TPA: hypothetical protein VHQ43_01575 [Solirubrobacterales bacterium]|nr:hypothetical protein [Solirubrobacterales bacterium]